MTETQVREETREWRPVPGDGFSRRYEVSSDGLVRAVAYTDARGANRRPYTRKTSPNSAGYLALWLSDGTKQVNRLVHHLVLEAFVGPRPEGALARHLNGNRTDNRAENLRWGTASENALDRVEHGTDKEARKTHCPHGHEYNEGNTYNWRGKARHCRTCLKLRKKVGMK